MQLIKSCTLLAPRACTRPVLDSCLLQVAPSVPPSHAGALRPGSGLPTPTPPPIYPGCQIFINHCYR